MHRVIHASLVILLMLICLLSACTSFSRQVDKQQIEIDKDVTETIKDYDSSDSNLQNDENISFANTLYKKAIPASNLFKIIELPVTIDVNYEFYGFYDQYRLLTIKNNDTKNQEIGLYSYLTNQFDSLFDVPKGLLGILYYDDQLLIIEISEDEWQTRDIYLYDIKNGTLKKLLSSLPTDPFASNNHIVYDNKFYYDIVERDEKGLPLSVDLYSLDLESMESCLVQKGTLNPMIYQDRIIAFAKDDEGLYKKLTFLDTGEVMPSPLLRDICSNGSSILIINIYYSSPEQKRSVYMIKDMTNNEKIFSTGNSVDGLVTSSKYAAWRNYSDSIPMLYDYEKDSIITFDTIAPGTMRFILKDDYGIIINENQTDRIYYFEPDTDGN